MRRFITAIILGLAVLASPAAVAETRPVAEAFLNGWWQLPPRPQPLCGTVTSSQNTYVKHMFRMPYKATLVDVKARCAPVSTAETASTADCLSSGTMDVYACGDGESVVDGCTSIGSVAAGIDEIGSAAFTVAGGGTIEAGDWVVVRNASGFVANTGIMACFDITYP